MKQIDRSIRIVYIMGRRFLLDTVAKHEPLKIVRRQEKQKEFSSLELHKLVVFTIYLLKLNYDIYYSIPCYNLTYWTYKKD